jgi:hypothetical protein
MAMPMEVNALLMAQSIWTVGGVQHQEEGQITLQYREL